MSLTREEKKIVRARVAMLLDAPFFGNIVMQLELIEREDMVPPTMGTDGYRLFYHPEWVASITEEQLKGVLAHEVGHLVFLHLTRRQSREHIRWNISCDFAVNELVKKEFELPDGILYNPNFAGKTAEWIYNQLPETQVIEVTVTLDSHEDWKGGNGNSNGKKGKSEGGDEKAPSMGGDKNGDGEEESEAPADTSEGLEQHIREMVAQSANQARMKGKLPGYLKELVDETLQPRLDWKTILQDMIVSCAKSDFCMIPPNKKHLYRGFILPGITGSEINIACVIDTCLRGDMLINLYNGSKKSIRDIKVGDVLLGYLEGEYSPSIVQGKMSFNDQPILKIKTVHKTLFCTPYHRFLTLEGWKRADKLDIMETLLLDIMEVSHGFMDKKGNRISQSQLSFNEKSRDSKSTGPDYSLNCYEGLEDRLGSKEGGTNQGNKKSHVCYPITRGDRILCGFSGWRGHFNFGDKRFEEPREGETLLPFCSNIHLKFGYLFNGLAKRTISIQRNCPSANSVFLPTKNHLPSYYIRQTNNLTFESYSSLANLEKGTVPIINRVPGITREESLAISFQERGTNILANKETKFIPETILSIEKQDRAEQTFDVVTSLGNYLVDGIVCHNSGSISSKEMTEFLSEVKGICDAYEEYTIYLFTCDAAIHQRWEIRPFDNLPKILEGRGGTDFIPALKEAEKLPVTSIIYLTDGFGSFPDREPMIPVIWVSTTDYEYPWGQVIRLPERK